jgi:hypothetical protein
MARGTHSAIIEKTAPKKIRVVVGSVHSNKFNFDQIYTYIFI